MLPIATFDFNLVKKLMAKAGFYSVKTSSG
jgi:hypothetical protein